jgi:hypothetical protein
MDQKRSEKGVFCCVHTSGSFKSFYSGCGIHWLLSCSVMIRPLTSFIASPAPVIHKGINDHSEVASYTPGMV